MRTIIHDLDDTSYLNINNDDILVTDSKYNCIGCFNCWIKHPMLCTFKDNISHNGKNILNSDELIIISKCIDGCYSSKVKKILERSISYVEPFFTIRNKEIHHKTRTNKKINFKVYFYGNITDKNKEIATILVNANKKNLDTNDPQIIFVNDYKEIKI